MSVCHQGDRCLPTSPLQQQTLFITPKYLFLVPKGQTPFWLMRSLELSLSEELGMDCGLTAQMGVTLGHVPSDSC